MAGVTSIFNQSSITANPLATPQARSQGATSTSAGNSTDGSASTISANDFLTLLVSEMKNQDPTANNDPNQYINQLVQVNSLEQLISINQELAPPATQGKSAPIGSVPATSGNTSSVSGNTARSATLQGARSPSSANVPSSPSASLTPGSEAGNLSVPKTNPAAQKVANALTQSR